MSFSSFGPPADQTVGLTPVTLGQAVLEIDSRLSIEHGIREVDDRLNALGHRQQNALEVADRVREQSAFGRDLRDLRERLSGIVGEKQLVDACRAAVQKTQTILAALDRVIRLNDAIHHERVAKEPVLVERVEDEGARPVEHLVLEHERNVVLAAR